MVDVKQIQEQGFDPLKRLTTLHITAMGMEILNKHFFTFDECIDEVCFSLEIVDSEFLAPGKLMPTETNFESRTIRMLRSYAGDGKYKTMTDPLGWAAHEFFHAFCYSQFGWTRNDRDMYNFFCSEINKVYPENYEEYVPFVGQFRVMIERGNSGNIEDVIKQYNGNQVFNEYLELAKSNR